ncbi:MAG: MarR family winged helix-turn-helix transcriptional regulator [Lawsonibacter sp.]|jgi:DNA-binding MarR family transcriptional regulator
MPDYPGQLELLNQQLYQAHRNAVAAELTAKGLGEIGHPMLLTILKSSLPGDCQAQRDLAQLLNISPAAVANSLKSLERGGYIRREPGARDARRNRVLLTEKGKLAVEGCEQAFEAVAVRMLAGFSPEEKKQLACLRHRMLQNLQGYHSAPSQSKEEP